MILNISFVNHYIWDAYDTNPNKSVCIVAFPSKIITFWVRTWMNLLPELGLRLPLEYVLLLLCDLSSILHVYFSDFPSNDVPRSVWQYLRIHWSAFCDCQAPKAIVFGHWWELFFIYDHYLFPLFPMKSLVLMEYIYGRIKVWGKRRRNKLRSS